ncbi:MAG: hypothetical protein Q7T56_13635 [Nocardioidaceae bacterium]|nr:hypothetical protein [Nocardioidaceae bacterium]
MSDDTGADETTPWTDEARTRVRAAAQTMTAVVAAHATAIAEAGPDDVDTVAEADAVLLSACQEYADAQWELTGQLSPLWPIEDEDDHPVGSDPWPDAPPTGEDAQPTGDFSLEELAAANPIESEDDLHIVAVTHRHDYVVNSPAAVLEAGRRAYLENLAPGEEPAVDRDVTSVAQAMHQVAQRLGIDAFRAMPGLQPVVGLTVYVDVPVGQDAENDGEPVEVELSPELVPFLLGGDVLFAAQELYREDVRLLE